VLLAFTDPEAAAGSDPGWATPTSSGACCGGPRSSTWAGCPSCGPASSKKDSIAGVGERSASGAHRSIDGVLDAAGRLLAAPTPKADWQIKYLNELVDVLSKMRVGYRDEEIQRVTDDAELAR
jgi:hypothetical protein